MKVDFPFGKSSEMTTQLSIHAKGFSWRSQFMRRKPQFIEKGCSEMQFLNIPFKNAFSKDRLLSGNAKPAFYKQSK